MRTPPRTPRNAALWALPLALWTALPAIQWCPIEWSQVCTQALLACSAMPDAESKCSSGHCPLMADTPASQRSSSSRAYCLAGPNGGAADLHRDLRLHAPVLAAGVPAETAIDAAPRAAARRTLPLQSRPPPGTWRLLPPVRAPPSSLNA